MTLFASHHRCDTVGVRSREAGLAIFVGKATIRVGGSGWARAEQAAGEGILETLTESSGCAQGGSFDWIFFSVRWWARVMYGD